LIKDGDYANQVAARDGGRGDRWGGHARVAAPVAGPNR